MASRSRTRSTDAWYPAVQHDAGADELPQRRSRFKVGDVGQAALARPARPLNQFGIPSAATPSSDHARSHSRSLVHSAGWRSCLQPHAVAAIGQRLIGCPLRRRGGLDQWRRILGRSGPDLGGAAARLCSRCRSSAPSELAGGRAREPCRRIQAASDPGAWAGSDGVDQGTREDRRSVAWRTSCRPEPFTRGRARLPNKTLAPVRSAAAEIAARGRRRWQDLFAPTPSTAGCVVCNQCKTRQCSSGSVGDSGLHLRICRTSSQLSLRSALLQRSASSPCGCRCST